MPGNWNPEVYRERAKKWREAAAALPPGATKDAYLSIREGYEKLAELLAIEDQGPVKG